MNITTNNNIVLEYSSTGTFSDPIIIKMSMPDGIKQVIGSATQNWESDDAPVIYNCETENGEQIFVGDDWAQAESAFARYAKQYEKKWRAMRQDKAAQRVNEVSAVREHKGRNSRTVGISK